LSSFDLIIVDTITNKETKLNYVEEIGKELKELKEDYKNNASFLSGYDKQNYLNMLDDLSQVFEEKKEKLNPKKKFAFSKNNASNTTAAVRKDLTPNFDNSTNKNILHVIKENEFIIKNISDDNNLIIKQEDVINKNSLTIENITNCCIYILYNFKACYIKNIENCKIYIGSVAGGSHITDCKNSSIYLITHQLRIHLTFNSYFFIIVSSNPIIEDCRELKFSPLFINYSKFDENLETSKIEISKNKWNNVLDFKWHKKEKSPNFELIEQPETINLSI
jgi:hypothetical protein